MSFDPNNRELCPDGACIGVIGPDGRCKDCGKPGVEGVRDPRLRGLKSDDPGELVPGVLEREALDGPVDFVTRELCPDGACIGVIGPDGRCKDCGTSGRAAGLDPRTQGLRDDDEIAEELEANIAVSDLDAAPPDFAARELCPDGACIGVIGSDGRCKECGTTRASA